MLEGFQGLCYTQIDYQFPDYNLRVWSSELSLKSISNKKALWKTR